jgi:hypothetical protein
MLLDILPFGQFREIEKNIIEATVFEGVELDRQRIAQVAAGLDEWYGNEPYAILSNRVNRYSHTHESMQSLAELPNLSGLAILVYSSISTVAAGIHELYQDNAKVFYSRPAAVDWLRQTLVVVDAAAPELLLEKRAFS